MVLTFFNILVVILCLRSQNMIAELISIVKLGKELANSPNTGGKGAMKQIAKLLTGRDSQGLRKVARESTQFFPMIISSNAMSPRNLTTFMRVVQNQNVALLSLAIQNTDIVEYGKNASKLDFLKQLHSNIDLGTRGIGGEVAVGLVGFASESTGRYSYYESIGFNEIGANYDVLKTACTSDPLDPLVQHFQQIVQEAMNPDEKQLRDEIQTKEKQLHDLTVSETKTKKYYRDAIDAAHNKINSLRVKERSVFDEIKRIESQGGDASSKEKEFNKIGVEISNLENDIVRYEKTLRDELNDIQSKRVDLQNEMEKTSNKLKKDFPVDNTKTATNVRIDESDISKMAGLPPAVLSAEIIYKDPDRGADTRSTITTGIKTVPHLVDSDSMVSYLADSYTTGKPVFQFIRFITGEKRLIRDLWLNIDRSKFEAKASRSRNQVVWGRLRAYSQLSKVRRFISFFLKSAKRNPIIPNASLVISSQDNDVMRTKYAVDVMEADVAGKICNALGFVEIFIVNEDDSGKPEAVVYDRETATYQRYSNQLLNKTAKSDKMDTDQLVSLIRG